MKQRAAFALAAVAAAFGTAPACALTPAEVYAQVSGSVWRVVTYDQDNLPLGQGSGVVIGEGTVITNCHVLARAKRVSLKREKVSVDARLKQWDAQRDVCALEAAGLAAPTVTLGDSAKVQVGQPAYAIGNPKGLDLTMSAGLVSSLRKNEAGQLVLIQTSAAISGGSSGGGLFDDQGVLIGLTTIGSVTGDAQNLNFAVPVEWIKELPARHDKLNAKKAAAAASAASGVASSAASAPR
jgi:serine protease Do